MATPNTSQGLDVAQEALDEADIPQEKVDDALRIINGLQESTQLDTERVRALLPLTHILHIVSSTSDPDLLHDVAADAEALLDRVDPD